jgi:NADH-quinone oxidoreductase subunit N
MTILNLELMKEFLAIIPEITIFLGSLISIIYGSYFKKNNTLVVSVISLVTLSLSFYLLCDLYPLQEFVFAQQLSLDEFAAFSKLIILPTSIFVVLMLLGLSREKAYITFETPILIMLSTLGMLFMMSSNSLLSLYLSMEMMALPSYILAASNSHNSASTEAGIKYFILGSIASGLFLFGASFIYGFTGHITFNGIADFYNSVGMSANSDESVSIPLGFLVGLIFILIAFAFKISAAPFHMWAPDVYQGSPTIITAFFASAPKATALLLLIRLIFDPFSELSDQWQQIILFLSILSMLIGSLGAIMQKSFKRLLAYSSIGHVGFILAGLATGESIGLQSVIVYIIIYLTMTLAIFSLIMLVRKDGKLIDDIHSLAGLSKAKPHIAFAMAAILFSMAGIPPFAGFFAKFYILMPIIQKELYPLAIIFITASVIAAYYYLKIVKIMYFDDLKVEYNLLHSFALKVVAFIFVLFNIIYIIYPTPLLDFAEIAMSSIW